MAKADRSDLIRSPNPIETIMQSNNKKAYTNPQFIVHGPMEKITQNGGPSSAIDGLTGIDLDGNGTVDVPTGVTTGGALAGSM